MKNYQNIIKKAITLALCSTAFSFVQASDTDEATKEGGELNSSMNKLTLDETTATANANANSAKTSSEEKTLEMRKEKLLSDFHEEIKEQIIHFINFMQSILVAENTINKNFYDYSPELEKEILEKLKYTSSKEFKSRYFDPVSLVITKDFLIKAAANAIHCNLVGELTSLTQATGLLSSANKACEDAVDKLLETYPELKPDEDTIQLRDKYSFYTENKHLIFSELSSWENMFDQALTNMMNQYNGYYLNDRPMQAVLSRISLYDHSTNGVLKALEALTDWIQRIIDKNG